MQISFNPLSKYVIFKLKVWIYNMAIIFLYNTLFNTFNCKIFKFKLKINNLNATNKLLRKTSYKSHTKRLTYFTIFISFYCIRHFHHRHHVLKNSYSRRSFLPSFLNSCLISRCISGSGYCHTIHNIKKIGRRKQRKKDLVSRALCEIEKSITLNRNLAHSSNFNLLNKYNIIHVSSIYWPGILL